MITFFAVTTSVSPSPLTSICTPASVLPVNLPWPFSQVILFFLNRNSIPLVIFSTIASLRPSIFATSIFTPSTVMPWSARWCDVFSNSSDDASSAFDGMQPTFRHVPPSFSAPAGFFHFSIHATVLPSCAARIAAI